jgi:hypothetical protein
MDFNDDTKQNGNLAGYPSYPPEEDIYGMCQKMKNINPENTKKVKETSEKYRIGENNVKDFTDDLSGSDLDIPGPESDDESESAGSEDEENSFFSLGGDNHADLDENQLELQY